MLYPTSTKPFEHSSIFKFEIFYLRPVLFLESERFIDSPLVNSLPFLVRINLLILRTFPLILNPHLLNGWNELTFSVWIDSHSEQEWIVLYEKSMTKYANEIQAKNETVYCSEYVILKKMLSIKSS